MNPWSRALQGLPTAVLGAPGSPPSELDVLRVSGETLDSWADVARRLPARPGWEALVVPVEHRWVAPVRPRWCGLEQLPESSGVWVSEWDSAPGFLRDWLTEGLDRGRCPVVVQASRHDSWVRKCVALHGESGWSEGNEGPLGTIRGESDWALCLAALAGISTVSGLADAMGTTELCALSTIEAGRGRGLPIRSERHEWSVDPDFLDAIRREASPLASSWLGVAGETEGTTLTVDLALRLGWHRWCLEHGATGDEAGLASWQIGDMDTAFRHLEDPRARLGLAFDLGRPSSSVQEELAGLPELDAEGTALCFDLRGSVSGAVERLLAFIDRLDGPRRTDFLEVGAHLPTFGIEVSLHQVDRWIDEALETEPGSARRGRLHRASGRVALLRGDRIEAANQFGAALPHLHQSRQSRVLAMCLKNLASVMEGEGGWSDLLGWLDAAVELARHDEEARVWCRAAVEQLARVLPATDAAAVTHLRRLELGLS